ncbi:MAG: GH32 C-terminal domain-containing protein [Capnocytophaga sp.]|nr:GH32 C-terminal domain-containing protein [Capnocytophaga sp.]
MRKKIILCGTLALIMAQCTPTSDIIIDDFESGNFDKWTLEGDAFGNVPVQGSYSGQQPVSGFEGSYLANSFNGGDDTRGTLTSKEFTIERDYINFLIGGGTHQDIYIELLINGQSVYKTRSLVESETLQWQSWEVKNYRNKKAVIRIVDNQRGGWRHILIDQIEQGNKSKSDFMTDYTLFFDVNKKFLLVPIENEAPDNKIRLVVDNQQVGEAMDFRLAQSKIDYWVPISVEKYNGKKVELHFSPLKINDIGYKQIKQGDTYDFNYSERYRPLYHFSPQYGWMNDPNGMVYHNGEYHLYFQHNPYGTKWGNMHWGHAVSRDLVSWEYLPVAISPDALGTIFSGSAVVDKHNTAGFGKDAIIAIYTSAGKSQTQSISYSTDNGRTFTTYDQNPVLSDPNIVDFRDPKVFWHDVTEQWVMSLATSQTITFYGSKNLKKWEKLSEFGEGLGAHGGVWECPDLFPLIYNGKTKWVLFVSINPGGINGGSATQYFIGDFDGKTFTPDKMNYPLWLDYGRDNYAGVTWSNTPENRRIFIGWMNNWDYANYIPTEYFRSAMTLPRELKLTHNGEHLVLSSVPVKELENLRRSVEKFENQSVEKNYTIEKLLSDNQGAYEIEFVVKPEQASVFEFKLFNQKNEEVRFIFDLDKKSLDFDRSKSGNVEFSNNFAAELIKSPLVIKKSYKVRLFVDKNSVEIFVNDGELVQTNTFFPTEIFNSLSFDVPQGKISVENISVYNLK